MDGEKVINLKELAGGAGRSSPAASVRFDPVTLDIDHVAEKKLVRKLDWYIIPMVMLLYLFVGSDEFPFAFFPLLSSLLPPPSSPTHTLTQTAKSCASVRPLGPIALPLTCLVKVLPRPRQHRQRAPLWPGFGPLPDRLPLSGRRLYPLRHLHPLRAAVELGPQEIPP